MRAALDDLRQNAHRAGGNLAAVTYVYGQPKPVRFDVDGGAYSCPTE